MNSFKKKIKDVIIAALLSIAIGLIFMWISTSCFNHSFTHYLWNAGYSLSIGMALFANAIVFSFVEKHFISWIDRPVKSIIIAIAFHLAYSTLVIFFFNWLWFVVLSHYTFVSLIKEEWLVFLGLYLVLIIITAIHYAGSFFKVWRDEAIEAEKLKKETIALQYQVMQNQVNPHFLFNSLNVLGTLIDIDAQKAKSFTLKLASFYRSLLQLKDYEIIDIQKEIELVERYVFLQKIRFEGNLNVKIDIDKNIKGELIPLSLQMLIENAVKHNEISKENSLNIVIGTENSAYIFVENNINPKFDSGNSNNIGLKNLTERYRYLTGNDVIVEHTHDTFKVSLPIIITEPWEY